MYTANSRSHLCIGHWYAIHQKKFYPPPKARDVVLALPVRPSVRLSVCPSARPKPARRSVRPGSYLESGWQHKFACWISFWRSSNSTCLRTFWLQIKSICNEWLQRKKNQIRSWWDSNPGPLAFGARTRSITPRRLFRFLAQIRRIKCPFSHVI